MTKVYRSDTKGRMFLSAAAFFVTIAVLLLLNLLRMYVSDKFPQYMPEIPEISLPEKVIIGIMILLAALYVIFIIIVLPLWYRSIKYVINDRELISYTGIVSRTYRIMKLSAVQHATRISMPFSEYTCFNFITVNALGGRVVMMFLSVKDCDELMEIFRSLPDAAAAKSRRKKSRFAVEKASEGGADYVYRDTAGLMESSDVFSEYADFPQLTFDDVPGSDDQLKFN